MMTYLRERGELNIMQFFYLKQNQGIFMFLVKTVLVKKGHGWLQKTQVFHQVMVTELL